MLKQKWWFYLLLVVLSLLIYRVGFYVPKPGFDPEKVESVLAANNNEAPSIADVKCLDDKEMQRLIAEHTVTLSEDHRIKLLKIIDTIDSNSVEPFRELARDLRNNNGKVLLNKFSPFQEIDLKEHLHIFRKLSTHPDISFRIFCLLMRIKSYDVSASKELKQLIGDEMLSVEDKRVLKSWCVGIGIDVVNDSAQDIYGHIQMAMGDGDLQPKIGEKAPLFEIKDINGKTVSLAKLKGKPIILHFWATWCGPCMFEIDRIQSYFHYMIEEDKIVVIGVNLDETEDEFQAAIKKHKLNWIHNFEGKGWGSKIGRLYKVNSLPTDFVIDQNGIVASYNYQDIYNVLTINENTNKGVEPTQ